MGISRGSRRGVSFSGSCLDANPFSSPSDKRGNLLTNFSPFSFEVSQNITTFSPSTLYVPENASDFFSPATREAWLGLVPRGLGYVLVKSPEEYDKLPHQLTGPNYEGRSIFTTSVTHQLHCLYAIIESHAAYEAGVAQKENNAWHLAHCFDYLRQSIMCCADTALEGDETTFPDGVTGSDGWDAKHVCKDYGQVKKYLEENRAGDKLWI